MTNTRRPGLSCSALACFNHQPKMTIMTYKYAYLDNTGSGTHDFHPVIMRAIANGGVFDDDFADIFKLTKTPDGSAAEYILTFA